MGEKVREWKGMTKTHAFQIDVFEDREQGLYTAVVAAHTPSMAQTLRLPGQKVATMNYEDEQRICSDDFDTLLALTKKFISEHWGEILHFRP